MYNMMLDKLPTDYKGYLMRTSFRIGVQICLCAKDEDYTEEEKLYIMLNLLYGNGIPHDINVAVEGLHWFLSCGREENNHKSSSKELFYWDFDHEKLYSSFMSTYGIDITKEDMHWFKFVALIGSLRKDSAFNGAVAIRSYDTSELKGKALREMRELQESLKPPVQLSSEEQEALAEFDALFSGGGAINE